VELPDRLRARLPGPDLRGEQQDPAGPRPRYYFIAQSDKQLPIMFELGQLNLLVGVSFMAVGFTYATKWE
jgi:hypothetical protein